MQNHTMTFDTEGERDAFEQTLRRNACPYRGLFNVAKRIEYGTRRPMLVWTTGSLD